MATKPLSKFAEAFNTCSTCATDAWPSRSDKTPAARNLPTSCIHEECDDLFKAGGGGKRAMQRILRSITSIHCNIARNLYRPEGRLPPFNIKKCTKEIPLKWTPEEACLSCRHLATWDPSMAQRSHRLDGIIPTAHLEFHLVPSPTCLTAHHARSSLLNCMHAWQLANTKVHTHIGRKPSQAMPTRIQAKEQRPA